MGEREGILRNEPPVPGSTPRRPQIKALTTIRIVAAMHVVLHHCAAALWLRTTTAWAAQTATSPAPIRAAVAIIGGGILNILDSGRWSVSLFFILSGFILTYNYLDGISRPGAMRRFWVARFARIYPVYLIGLAIASPLFFYAGIYRKEFSLHSMFAQAILCFTLLQSWCPAYALAWNSPAWSLSVEAFFYAMFPLLAFALARKNRAESLIAVIAACWLTSLGLRAALLTLAGGWQGHMDYEHSRRVQLLSNFFSFFPVCRIPEFIAGMALGRLLLLKNGIPNCRWPTATALASAAVLLIFAAIGERRRIIVDEGVLTPLFALLIWSLSDPRGRLASMMQWSPLILLGEASYTVYICHFPLANLMVRSLMHFWRGQGKYGYEIGSYPVLLAYLLGLLITCVLIYRFIEIPARDRIKGFLNARRESPAIQNI